MTSVPPPAQPPTASPTAIQPIGPMSPSGPPVTPTLVPEVTGELLDELTWRRFQARYLHAIALSTQRTEWYARSVRLYVMAFFWITVVAAVVFGILLASAVD